MHNQYLDPDQYIYPDENMASLKQKQTFKNKVNDIYRDFTRTTQATSYRRKYNLTEYED